MFLSSFMVSTIFLQYEEKHAFGRIHIYKILPIVHRPLKIQTRNSALEYPLKQCASQNSKCFFIVIFAPAL